MLEKSSRQSSPRENAEVGRKYGLKYAEQFHYIGPEKPVVDDYIKQHAVPL